MLTQIPPSTPRIRNVPVERPSTRLGATESISLGDAALRESLLAFATALAIMSPIVLGGGWLTYDSWAVNQAHERLVAAPAAPLLPVEITAHGRDLFASACVSCHAADGTGVSGLGKDLTRSDFVALQTDDMLLRFIVTGRPDAKPIPMPPKAGRDELTDDDIGALVAFVRALQDPRRRPALPAPAPIAPPAPSAAQKDAALAAAGGDAELAGYIAHGDTVFHSVCIACHGKGGRGIKGNGKALASNEFIRSIDDDALLAFVKQGRGPSDPKNTTGIQMPPKGGNPALSDDDILDIIAYLRTLQGAAPEAKQPETASGS